MRRTTILRLAVMLAAVAAAVFALNAEAIGEEAGGALTGKFNVANYAGVVWLFATALLALTRPRTSFLAALFGAVMISPMQSWRLFPGLWCALGNCSIDPPLLTWNFSSVASFLLAVAAVILSARLRPR